MDIKEFLESDKDADEVFDKNLPEKAFEELSTREVQDEFAQLRDNPLEFFGLFARSLTAVQNAARAGDHKAYNDLINLINNMRDELQRISNDNSLRNLVD